MLAVAPGTEVLDAPAVLAEVPGLRCPEPDGRYAQFWPHRHGTDAIFLALLRQASGQAAAPAPGGQPVSRSAGRGQRPRAPAAHPARADVGLLALPEPAP